MKTFSRINCFSCSINESRNSHMNPRLAWIHSQSTESMIRTILQRKQQAYTIFQNWLWVKILKKMFSFLLIGAAWTVSFSFVKNTAWQCNTSQDFGAFFFQLHAALVSTFNIISFLFLFLSVLFFLLFWCVFTKTISLFYRIWNDYNQLGTMRLVGYLSSHIWCTLVV